MITGDKPQDLWEQAAFFHSLPSVCPVEGCGAELLITCRHPTQKITYYGLLCKGTPAHECNLSEHADHSGMFYRGNVGKNAFKLAYGATADYRVDEQQEEHV